MNVSANEMPYKIDVEKSFIEKEATINEFYDLFQNEKKIKILNYRPNDKLTTSIELFGKEKKYWGWNKKKYLKYKNLLYSLDVSNIVREIDRISITVATARKYGAFIEVELNRYFEAPIETPCESPDFTKEGFCLIPIKGKWFLKYVWFAE